jgi:hypothetical protein
MGKTSEMTPPTKKGQDSTTHRRLNQLCQALFAKGHLAS